MRALDEAARLYGRGVVPDVRSVAALKARRWVARGCLAEALGWARRQGLSADDDLAYPSWKSGRKMPLSNARPIILHAGSASAGRD